MAALSRSVARRAAQQQHSLTHYLTGAPGAVLLCMRRWDAAATTTAAAADGLLRPALRARLVVVRRAAAGVLG